MTDPAASPRPALGAALRRIGAASLRLVSTRIELAALELGEAQRTLVRWFALCLAAGLLALLAAIALTAALVVALWGTLGWLGLVAFALVYAIAAGALVVRVRGEVAHHPGVLATTMAELRSDLEELQPARDARQPAAETP